MAKHLRLVKTMAETAGPSRLLIVSDVITATQYISFLQPLQALAEEGRMRLFFEDCPRTAAASEAMFQATAPDCLVLSRCTLPGGEPLVKLARQHGIPYIYHIDDDHSNTEHDPRQEFHGDDSISQEILLGFYKKNNTHTHKTNCTLSEKFVKRSVFVSCSFSRISHIYSGGFFFF